MDASNSRRLAENVSLVDLLPTLLEIGGDKRGDSLVEPLAGNSLWGLVTDSVHSWDHPVFSENLAEGATTPLLMVKQDGIKYIHSAVDPHRLYDIENDPNEQVNQIDNPDYRQSRELLASMVRQQWDIEILNQQILLSQQRRIFLREALAKGDFANWDFKPEDQQQKHSLRNGKNYSDWAYQDILGYHIPGA